jgi:hypothetical protein
MSCLTLSRTSYLPRYSESKIFWATYCLGGASSSITLYLSPYGSITAALRLIWPFSTAQGASSRAKCSDNASRRASRSTGCLFPSVAKRIPGYTASLSTSLSVDTAGLPTGLAGITTGFAIRKSSNPAGTADCGTINSCSIQNRLQYLVVCQLGGLQCTGFRRECDSSGKSSYANCTTQCFPRAGMYKKSYILNLSHLSCLYSPKPPKPC